jgi:predicted acyltransferase
MLGDKHNSMIQKSERSPVPSAQPQTASKRLLSLDAFRGWTMFWIVGGGSLMLGFQALGNNPVINFIIYHLDHTSWQGLRYYDIIWPSFMLMTGMSLPFSYSKRIQTSNHSQIFLRVIRRVVVLFLLGSLRESISLNHPYLIELSSALQPIAIAYFVAFLLVRRSWLFQVVTGMLLLFFYALILALISAPSIPAGSYNIGHNLVAYVDVLVLGRTHPDGWGTVLSTIPIISTTILGLLIGRILKSELSPKRKCTIIGLMGFGCVLTGTLLDPIIPIIMKLWTTSYGLATMGWSCLLFLLFYWIIDVKDFHKWAFPFVVIGMNALAVYMGRAIVPLGKIVGIFTAGSAIYIEPFGELFKAIAVLLVEWLILYWMYKRKLFLIA